MGSFIKPSFPSDQLWTFIVPLLLLLHITYAYLIHNTYLNSQISYIFSYKNKPGQSWKVKIFIWHYCLLVFYFNLFKKILAASTKRDKKHNFVYPKALLRTFHTSFMTTKSLWIHNTRSQIQKVILYSKTGFNRSF